MALNINFYCRKSKESTRTGKATIEMAVSLDGKRSYIPLEIKCTHTEFKKLYGSKKDNYIKEYCTNVELKVKEIVSEMVKRSIPLTTANLITYYKQGGFNKVCTLDELFAEYNNIKEEEFKNGHITKVTYNRYQLTQKLFYEYCSLKGSENVAIVNIGHYRLFETKLKSNYKVSYVAGFLKKIKSVFKFAWESGKITKFPFINTKIERGKTEITYLTTEQLKQIEEKHFDIERLEKTKDVFLFQCYTGLSYVDMKGLKKEDYKKNNDNVWYIKGKRQKTGGDYFIMLFTDAVNILRKYDFELPVISYQNYNAYIKEVCALCGIEMKVSTHLARRTCACYLLNNGVSDESVARMLGDSVAMVRQHYAVLFDTTVIKDVEKVEAQRIRDAFEKLYGTDIE